MRELIERFMNENRLNRLEGETGVKNLCRLARALGYHDRMYFGQFGGAAYGDLINFLEDNPGCCQAIVEWIGRQSVPEWVESLTIEDEEGEAHVS
jgi:hypothetical protein